MKQTFEWRTTKMAKDTPVKVISKSEQTYMYTFETREVATEFTADYTVEIDLEKLITQYIRRAAESKSGRATALGGLVKVRRGKVRDVKETVRALPIPEHMEPIPLAVVGA